ncbi:MULTISPECIES: Ig-like domain-containing protein [unclassified Mesobacillus]|uniref:Ig-like domain repeat protein n=1 Tax=unclassified Mesobacillus TaxID=2675270 RepID=UPI00203CFA6E|nr:MULTISPECIES: Ig-like domain-containing protein [unclassified Mesobacillus]MCM3123809.1 Ig-like domain-containing protein [Mesobacillus sp. MER 33]MCM3234176.1 Ig-like domain-containing protein [Mesobacillus sp. MER 48]
MLEPRKKKRRPNKWAIVIPILLVLISSVLVFNGRAWSNGEIERKIIFNESRGEIWNLSEGDFKQDWKTNSNPVSFIVDLSQDFTSKNLPESSDRPFTINVQSKKGVINSNSIVYKEIAEPKFTGKYLVEIPYTEDGDLQITLLFSENNQFNIDADSKIFVVQRDITGPELTLSGIEDGSLSTSAVSLDATVNESGSKINNIVVSALKNGKSYTAFSEIKNIGNPKENQYTNRYTFKDEGLYSLEITAYDDLGNESETKEISFVIRQKGAALVVSAGDRVIEDGGYLKTNDIDISVSSGVPLESVEATITKENGDTEVYNLPVSGSEAVLSYPVMEGEYSLKISVNEKHGNIAPYQLETLVFTVDNTEPRIQIDGLDGDNFNTNKSITITILEKNINSSDFKAILTNISGEKKPIPIPVKNGVATFTTTEDGKYELELTAVDKANNTNLENQKVLFTIDTNGPELLTSEEVNGQYFNTSKKIAFYVNDFNLLLNNTSLSYRINNSADYVIEGLKTSLLNPFSAEVEHEFTKEGKYTISMVSTDSLNLEKESRRNLSFTIDKTDPLLSIKRIIDDKKFEINDEKYSEDVDVDVSAVDPNLDLDKTVLTIIKNGKLISELKGEKALEVHSFSEGVYKLKLIVFDKAGNDAVSEVTFTVDKNAPKIKIYDKSDITRVINKEHFENITLNVEVQDLMLDLTQTFLEVKKDGKAFKTKDWDKSVEENGELKAIKDIAFIEDGDYEITIKSKDLLHPLVSDTVSFTIDNKEPIVEMSSDTISNGKYVQKGDVYITVNEHNYLTNDIKLEATRVAPNGKLESYEMGKWNHGEISTLQHKFTKEGKYNLIVSAIDKAGNPSNIETLTFTVDTTSPDVGFMDVKPGYYYAAKQEVGINIDELNFRNNDVVITVNRDGNEKNISDKWNNVGKKSTLIYPVEFDGRYIVRVTATDKAGNSKTESVQFTIDKTLPEINITGVETNHNYRTNKPVSMKVTDRNIDLSQTNLKVKKDNKAYGIGDPELKGLTSAEKEFTFKQEGSYTINLDTTDKAGNKKVHEQIGFIIDKTNPVVKIDGVENNSFNPENKNVTISIDELNYVTNNVSISATKDGASFPIGTWRNSGKLSKLGYNFTRDGLYTILATAEDKAGNGPITEKRTFTIDKTKPEIEITGVENNAYYNVDKPVNATIKDVNLDINRITVTRNGARYNAGGFSVNGNLASFRHNFSGEGEYNILVEATDKAGNSFSKTMTFTIDKTKPVITPKFKGQNRVIKDGEYINEVFTPEFALDEAEDMIVSATLNNGANLGKNIPVAAREMKYTYKVLARDKAGNESTLEISFTLDTTKPALNISGVLDGFFNKNITPKVTYSDIHLDSSKTSVTLNGKPFENGAKLEYEQDYILKAVITDLAKNVSSRTIVFTIDKTKPVIKFKEPISNKYFNTDLLPQLLIDDMSSYDIIAMMLDGKPYEKGDPIKEEGKHVMFFEVKDKAGNIQQLSVEFIIDKTAPKVMYEGVKNKGKYYDPVDVAIRLDNPNDKIKSVMINGEMFDGDVIEENGFKVIKTKLAEIKSYEIKVTASDEAGNEKTTVISFEIVEKGALVKFYENKPLLGGTVAGLVGLIGATATMMVRRRKLKVEEE